MKALFFTLAIFLGLVPALAIDHNISQAEADAANVKTLVLNGSKNESARLLKLAPKLVALETVVIDGISSDQTATNLVSSVAACNKVRTINFRNCKLEKLPANLRMLTQVNSFESENTEVADGEQFYNSIADMSNVRNVTVTGSEFRSLPKSFSRLRTMDNISLVNTDLQLASGYDLNNKTPDELRATETVQFGFDDDALNLNYTCFNAEAAKSHVQMFRDVLQGAYRETNVFYVPANTRVFKKQHPLVKPPVKGVDIAPDVYSVNAMTGSVVEYGSGTRISIPSMAFEDANGTPVQGKVDITYREFRDPVDIILSGIPMNYDSAGTGGDFKSAGMFEMQASQGGTEVFLREGKKVDMKFSVTDTSSAYDFYRLDEQKGWVYLTDPGKAEQDAPTVEQTVATTRQPDDVAVKLATIDPNDTAAILAATANVTQIQNATFAVQMYWDGINKVRVRNWIKDTTDFDRRYEDTCYFGTYRSRINNANNQKAFVDKQRASSRLYCRRRASGADYTVISLEQVSASYGMNPELAAYAGYFWKIDGKMSGRQVSTRFGRKSGINDMRIIQDGTDYYLEMKYFWGYDRIKAEPVKLDDKKKPVSLKDDKKSRLFRSYDTRLENRRKQMNRNNDHQKRKHLTRVQRAHNDSIRVWKGLNKEMNDEEKAMDFPAWKDYVKKQRIKMFATILNGKTAGESAAYQALSISGMGIFNCDQVFRMTKPKEFVAKTIKVVGAVIVPVCIFVIDKAKNMVFRYGGVWAGEQKPRRDGVAGSYDQGSTNQMLATDAEGNLYQVTEQEFGDQAVQGTRDMDFSGVPLSVGGETTPESVRQAVFPDPAVE